MRTGHLWKRIPKLGSPLRELLRAVGWKLLEAI